MTLEAGDVILTGTPEGVSRVDPGQTIECGIDGLMTMRFNVIAEA
jgi:fumarylpyruvate hydrolase